jgi:hypothetical protein
MSPDTYHHFILYTTCMSSKHAFFSRHVMHHKHKLQSTCSCAPLNPAQARWQWLSNSAAAASSNSLLPPANAPTKQLNCQPAVLPQQHQYRQQACLCSQHTTCALCCAVQAITATAPGSSHCRDHQPLCAQHTPGMYGSRHPNHSSQHTAPYIEE